MNLHLKPEKLAVVPTLVTHYGKVCPASFKISLVHTNFLRECLRKAHLFPKGSVPHHLVGHHIGAYVLTLPFVCMLTYWPLGIVVLSFQLELGTAIPQH